MDVDRILVPVDYSEQSRRALQHAIWLAEKLGAKVDVLHVTPKPAEYLPLDKWIWGEERAPQMVEAKVREAAQKALREFLKKLPQQQREAVDARVELGVPSKVITEALDKGDYSLVVMGTRGRAQHVLLGSTAERVIRRASCPVLTVH